MFNQANPPTFVPFGDGRVCAECGGRDENGGIHADYCKSKLHGAYVFVEDKHGNRLVRLPK